MQADLLPIQAQAGINSVCKWRATILSVPNPLLVPDTNEVLHYLTSIRACENPRPERLPKGGKARRQTKGEGWRRIRDEDVWFDCPWHANFARFMSVMPEMFGKWYYKPQTFKVLCCGTYTPTFRVFSMETKQFEWVELDGRLLRIRAKAGNLEFQRPEIKITYVIKDIFLSCGCPFNEIPGWEG